MSDEGARVLVVDDNEMNRDMLSRRLLRLNYEVIMAEDGEQALAMVKQHAFDLVLLDIMMPNISGYEVLERMKADDATRHIPVIMISAVDDLDSVVRCIELGAEDYLFKPFNPVLLKARVGASLRRNATGAGDTKAQVEAVQAAVARLAASGLNAEQAAILAEIEASLKNLV
jgi:DNA-binding response OmpR family regulator